MKSFVLIERRLRIAAIVAVRVTGSSGSIGVLTSVIVTVIFLVDELKSIFTSLVLERVITTLPSVSSVHPVLDVNAL